MFWAKVSFLSNQKIEWYYIISVVLECHMLKYPPSKLLCRIPNFYLMWHSTRKIACYILYIHSSKVLSVYQVCSFAPKSIPHIIISTLILEKFCYNRNINILCFLTSHHDLTVSICLHQNFTITVVSFKKRKIKQIFPII